MTLIYNDTIDYGDVIAVGDIHARYDLLELLLDKIRGSQAIVVFLGDLVDRGGQDVEVIERVRKLETDPESEGLSNVFVLRGNHESMLVDAYVGCGMEFGVWVRNGGNFDQFPDFGEHISWLDNLPIYITIGDTLFIHAGVFPGVDPVNTINNGYTEDLLWMRSPFLEFGPEFEKWSPTLKRVVFGHTPQGKKPYEIPNGVCIDSGAYHTGILTAWNDTKGAYFQVEGECRM